MPLPHASSMHPRCFLESSLTMTLVRLDRICLQMQVSSSLLASLLASRLPTLRPPTSSPAMNLNVATPIQQAAARLRTRRGAICGSPSFAADLQALVASSLSNAANVAAPAAPNSALPPSSPMRGAMGSAVPSAASPAAASPLRPRIERRNALTPNSRRELRMMLQLPVSPAPSPKASPLNAPSMTRSISASFVLRSTPESDECSAGSSTETPLQSRRGSVVSSADESSAAGVFSPRASAMMSFFGGAGSSAGAAAGSHAESPSMSPQSDTDALQFIPPRVRNLERRRAIINHSEFFATIPEQWQAGAVPAPTSPRIRVRRPSSPFVGASAAAAISASGSRSIFQVLTSIPPTMSLAAVDSAASPVEGAMDGAFISPMWSPSQ